MLYDDLNFIVKDTNGNDVKCEILSLIPKDEKVAYVVYTTRELDENENIIFRYGRLIKDGEDHILTGKISEEELEYIKQEFHEDLIKLSKSILQNM